MIRKLTYFANKTNIKFCYYSYEHKGEFDMRKTSEGSHSSLFVLDYFGLGEVRADREHIRVHGFIKARK